MKIIKYKKNKSNKYDLYLDNGDVLKLYDDTIIHFNLLIKKEIEDVEEIDKYNKYMEAYYKSIKYLNKKMRTTLEIKEYLDDYPHLVIDMVIERLLKEGYLNDNYYLKMFISNQIAINNYGPNKIVRKLMELGFDKESILNGLNEYNKDVFLEKLDKIIEKKIRTNYKYSSNKLREKLIVDMYNYGYDKKDIIDCLNNKEIKVSSNIIEKEYKKVYKVLVKKYEGYELERRIMAKLLAKGFSYEEIKNAIKNVS